MNYFCVRNTNKRTVRIYINFTVFDLKNNKVYIYSHNTYTNYVHLFFFVLFLRDSAASARHYQGVKFAFTDDDSLKQQKREGTTARKAIVRSWFI